MSKPNDYQDLLVIRPWVSSYAGGGSFGHFDAVAMRRFGPAAPQFYGELEMLQAGEDGRKVLLLDRFRFECQVDECQPEPYCWRWGYSPANCSMFTTSDLDRFGKSLRAIERGLQRLEGAGGVPGSVGSFVARLATVLSVDGIVTLELTPNRMFGGHLSVRHRATAPRYSDVIGAIDGLAAELQSACAAQAPRC